MGRYNEGGKRRAGYRKRNQVRSVQGWSGNALYSAAVRGGAAAVARAQGMRTCRRRPRRFRAPRTSLGRSRRDSRWWPRRACSSCRRRGRRCTSGPCRPRRRSGARAAAQRPSRGYRTRYQHSHTISTRRDLAWGSPRRIVIPYCLPIVEAKGGPVLSSKTAHGTACAVPSTPTPHLRAELRGAARREAGRGRAPRAA